MGSEESKPGQSSNQKTGSDGPREEEYFVLVPLSKMSLNSIGSHRINALFMSQQDTSLINKYRVNYSCLCQAHSQQKAKADFISLARKNMPQQQQAITQFEKQFRLDLPQAEADAQVLSWASKNSFFWDLIQEVPKLTTDPRHLAYLRLPFQNLYKAIRNSYAKKRKLPNKLFIVTVLSNSELEKLKKNKDSFMIFTSFMRAFKTPQRANQAKKSQENSTMFQVYFQKQGMDEEVDFGYAQLGPEGDIIFNIYNFFKIGDMENGVQELVYGALALASAKRIDKNKQRIGLLPYEQDLLRNYDYVDDLVKGMNNQATVLQMLGYFKESIEIFEKKSQSVGKSRASQQVVDKYILQMGDAYKLSEDYKRALEQYSKVATDNMKLVAQVHIAQLYYQSKDKAKFRSTIATLQPRIPDLLKYNPPEAFKAMNYVAISMMNEEKYKQANKEFNEIMGVMTKYYNYKYEGMPLVHDMLRNKATCESKMKNYAEALNLLRSTKGWQKMCEGNSPNYALTQTMIQQVHLSKGDQFKAKQSQAELNQIKKSESYTVQEQDYINKSRVVINLNESLIKIDF